MVVSEAQWGAFGALATGLSLGSVVMDFGRERRYSSFAMSMGQQMQWLSPLSNAREDIRGMKEGARLREKVELGKLWEVR